MKDNFFMTSSCIQGGCPHPINEYRASHGQIGPHSPLAAWQYPPNIQNQDRNDSGINSGSDCHSSSPGSENSGEVYTSSSEPLKVAQFSTPIYPKGSYHSSNLLNTLTYSSENSYITTPSNFSNVIKTEPKDEDDDEDNTTPTNNSVLKNLEMSVERNLASSVSPGISETSMDDDKKSDHTPEHFDENGHRIPRLNSHGKIKTFKCKQCDFQAITKFDFWQHQRHHIKPDKILSCPKCPFVTEYKHHLEYHLRNHEGSKPFKCEHCDYTCVNKSMLNSHKKSHSNIYQYRCANCHYASKYCHSLKLHLRKYEHSPAMVLNPDGSPNPLPIVDVYGTRRGPKIKSIQTDINENQQKAKRMKTEIPTTPPYIPNHLQQLMAESPAQLPFPYTWIQQAMLYRLVQQGNLSPKIEEPLNIDQKSPKQLDVPTDSSGALDLSKNDVKDPDNSLKLDTPSSSSDEEEENSTTMFANVEVVHNEAPNEEKENSETPVSTNSFSCQYCDISFGDAVLYTMHMGYHGFQDPFACNMCGEKCSDKVSFFLHIARTSHS